jgi:hypothetical protein
MHPYIAQSVAAERTRDMLSQAKAAERARHARRSRPVSPARAAVIHSGRRLAHRAA